MQPAGGAERGLGLAAGERRQLQEGGGRLCEGSGGHGGLPGQGRTGCKTETVSGNIDAVTSGRVQQNLPFSWGPSSQVMVLRHPLQHTKNKEL